MTMFSLRWYGTTQYCDLLPNDINNKIKYSFILFSFLYLIPNKAARTLLDISISAGAPYHLKSIRY